MFLELLKKSRTHRFFSEKKITEEEILKIMETARYIPSSRNSQNIRFAYTVDEKMCSEIFENIILGGYLKNRPTKINQPKAYILLCEDKKSKVVEKMTYFNMGVCAQTINLMANEMGYKTCILASQNKEKIDEIFNLTEDVDSKILIALGEGIQNIEIVDAKIGDNLFYYVEENKQYVPKLGLDEMLIKNQK